MIVHRSPVMIPSPQGWRGLETVRSKRITVEDGALVLRDSDQSRVLAPKGAVTRMLVVDPADAVTLVPPRKRAVCGRLVDEHGLLLAVAGDRLILALRIGEWLPTPERRFDDREARRLSGIEAVAAAMDLPLEYGDSAAVAPFAGQVRAGLIETSPRLPQGFAAASWVAVLAGVSAYALSFSIERDHALATWLIAPLLIVATLRAVWLAGLRLDAARMRARLGTSLQGMATVRPVPAPGTRVARGFRRRAALYLSEDLFVLVGTAGEEAWIPGPGAGGIQRATVNNEFVTFDDATGTGLASVALESWVGTTKGLDTLRRELAAFGVHLVEERLVRNPGGMFAMPVYWSGSDSTLLALRDSRDARGLPFAGEALTPGPRGSHISRPRIVSGFR